MSKKQKIDEVFSARFQNYQEEVPPYIWDNINQKLHSSKKKKILFVVRAVAASAAIFIAFTAGYFFSNFHANNLAEQNNEITISNSNQIVPESSSKDIIPVTSIKKKSAVQDVVNKKDKIAFEDDLQLSLTENETYDNNNHNNAPDIPTINADQNETSFMEYITKLNFIELERQAIEKSICYPENILIAYVESESQIDESKLKDEINKWLLGGNMAANYSYRDITGSSNNSNSEMLYSDSYDKNIEKGVITYSGGVNVGYQISKRINVFSGVYYSEIGQMSENIQIDENQSRASESLNINSSAGKVNTNISSFNLVNSMSTDFHPLPISYDTETLKSNTISTDFYQSFEFIEIPVIVKYKVIDKKIDLNLIGGFSTNFLIDNNAYLDYENEKYSIGETENIENTNFKTTIAIGVEYEIGSNFSLNVEPTFKYFINSINSESSVHPFTMGVFTGINYKF